jgi:V/A-type H+/Na+-transporting ATPase subunit E
LIGGLVKFLESGNEKIQKICDSLKKETLEPAKQEAREIVEVANGEAAQILKEAKEKAARVVKAAEVEIGEKQRVGHAALNLACRQAVEALKQRIEKELFNPAILELVDEGMGEKLVEKMVEAFLKTMEAKGLEADLVVPKGMEKAVAAKVAKKLKGGTVIEGDFAGGVQIKLKGSRIDVSDGVVKELIAQYIRNDLRDLIFGAAK